MKEVSDWISLIQEVIAYLRACDDYRAQGLAEALEEELQ